ncbi:hypothetical protein M409DRAFT_18032 [Zasmidium cellare ATCC 36951]|uniref:Uncharacterized protein n=1 Tax=Zasmidium cellare ATCC 36951 TaxID=1080233 RepID=A0A6A6D127_ZASCE|nr:uncharacterized protein M409DRAFT_18032 [Zasmidium cellare ATCC 36951]KAF2171799.1 hypothetical protein M409DRAFT_18032 [Zasmidium cellare ATCC 36951]
MAVSRPITNLALPQEVKDKIWSYFLDGEVVREPHPYKYQPAGDFYTKDMRNRDWPRPERGCLQLLEGTNSTYDFQMGLLRVNKAIRGDALNFLAQRNPFVLVRYNCPALRAYLDQLHVPVVAHGGSRHSSYHNFEVDIDWPCPFLQAASVHSAPNPPGVLLMLEKDMPDFWLVLRLLCQKVKPSAIVYHATPGRMSSIYNLHHDELDHWVGIPAVKISGRSIEHRRLTQEVCHRFLDPIQSVVGFGYNIHFHGLGVEAPRLLRLRQVIAPSIICSTARESFDLDTLLQLKERADVLAVAGNYEAAEAMFGCIETPCHSASLHADSEHKESLDHLRASVLLSMAWLCCRRGATGLASRLSASGCSRVPRNSSNAALGTFHHMDHVISAVTLPYDLPFWMVTPEMILADMEALPRNERITNDILWLRRMLLQAPISQSIIHLEDTSVCKFPFPVFDSGSRPSLQNIVGWQDMKQLRELSNRQKDAARALQKEHGLPISDL